ncbi:hypothetical protein [Nocardia salmonicida]|uniref:hypothetical protein n=1 Tax=Nocardia salmonicida TaxID=53431 RepID=UPI0007A5326D|nr:hypothetical protein [Nocardia salmonicida]
MLTAETGHPGVDLYLVDARGVATPAFPDTGLRMDQVHQHLPGDPRTACAAAGLGHLSTPPSPLPRQDDSEADDTYTARETARLRAVTGPGIALHKLTGSEFGGWWVTATECAQALDGWKAAGSPALPGDDLAQFLTRAAASGGFRAWQAY